MGEQLCRPTELHCLLHVLVFWREYLLVENAVGIVFQAQGRLERGFTVSRFKILGLTAAIDMHIIGHDVGTGDLHHGAALVPRFAQGAHELPARRRHIAGRGQRSRVLLVDCRHLAGLGVALVSSPGECAVPLVGRVD